MKEKPIVITCVGSGDSGKTSTLIALAYQLAARKYKCRIVGFDPEQESSLTRLLAATIPKDMKRPTKTIVDLLKLPWPQSRKQADEMSFAIDEATLRHPAGFGIVTVNQALVDYEVEGGDIYGLLGVVSCMKDVDFVLIDCAAGTGGFSLLSAVAASKYVFGVAKPMPKSIAIARRACGLDPCEIGDGEMGSFLEMLSGIDETSGLTFGATYGGMIGTMFVGAKWNGDGIEIAKSGISSNLRDYMNQIISCSGFIDFTPYRTGSDQSEVVKAYERITDRVLKIITS